MESTMGGKMRFPLAGVGIWDVNEFPSWERDKTEMCSCDPSKLPSTTFWEVETFMSFGCPVDTDLVNSDMISLPPRS
jgi:hypothetical protein